MCFRDISFTFNSRLHLNLEKPKLHLLVTWLNNISNTAGLLTSCFFTLPQFVSPHVLVKGPHSIIVLLDKERAYYDKDLIGARKLSCNKSVVNANMIKNE